MNSNDGILKVTDDDISSIVEDGSSRKPILLLFRASWCTTCQLLEPMLEKIVDELNGKIVLAMVSFEENPKTFRRFSVRGIPVVKAFVNGEVVDEFGGILSPSETRAFIESIITKVATKTR